uniref:Spermidine/spermine N1-acetyltransferase family member 2b n=1 Tax=Gasterosteus aculeatus aculeatus TaxID=481459 RepID=A0AAQ4Q168_GASAC
MNVKVRPATRGDCKEISRMISELAVYEKMPEQVKITHEELERDGFCANPFFECLVAEVPEEHRSKEGEVSTEAFLSPSGSHAHNDESVTSLFLIFPTNHNKHTSTTFRNQPLLFTDSFSQLMSRGFPIVGYALYFYTYSTWKGRSVYLEDLYVMPDFRGKGIGKGLLSKVAEVGKKKQCVRLQLSVLDWNTPSRDFYAAKGAQDITASEGWRSLRFVGQDLDNLANEAPKD